MIGLFWDSQQQVQINNARLDAEFAEQQARHSLSAAQRQFRDLERRVDRLSLACQAMWELLRESCDFAEEEIVERMTEIDLRDGSADGKITPGAVDCPKCGRIGRQRTNCIYCGHEIPSGSALG